MMETMYGPAILARTLEANRREDKNGNVWQYHSRSDHHSKVACWGILFDLLRESPILREHVSSGAVVFGINHEMRDFKQNRKKDLDLVLARPRETTAPSKKRGTFKSFVTRYGIVLTTEEQKALDGLPDVNLGAVGAVQVALEAKACMTEHVKALPRLYDELNSSHETIHASADVAIAAGFVMINIASEFVSPGRQASGKGAKQVTKHDQPAVAERAVQKIHEMPRRTKPGEHGFDAMSIVVIDCRNDGSPVRVSTVPPAPKAGDIYEYGLMIRRVAQLYASRFRVL